MDMDKEKLIDDLIKEHHQEVKIIKKDEEELLPVEILQNSIVSLAEAFETFKKTRLKQDTIITLLHDTSKVSKRDIKTILNCLSELKRLYLK